MGVENEEIHRLSPLSSCHLSQLLLSFYVSLPLHLYLPLSLPITMTMTMSIPVCQLYLQRLLTVLGEPREISRQIGQVG